jgi:hypothetical protein
MAGEHENQQQKQPLEYGFRCPESKNEEKSQQKSIFFPLGLAHNTNTVIEKK